MKNLFFALVLVLPTLVQANEIALIQYNADKHFADYNYNLKSLTQYAEAAVKHGSKIIVFPEGSLYGYAGQNEFWCSQDKLKDGCRNVSEVAEEIPRGRSSRYWEDFSRKNSVYILFNIPEVESSTYFNTTVVFGPEGFVAKYRKRNLYVTDTYYASPGDLGPVSFLTPYGEFGLLICLDANFAKSFIEYVTGGVNNVIVPMDWDQDPNGGGNSRPARLYFQQMAKKTKATIYVSDVSPWDGTGVYRPAESVRERNGLKPVAIGENGISYHKIP